MALHTEPRDLFEAAARQYAVALLCPACGHRHVFDPHRLWWLFERRGWNARLGAAARRFVCRACGARGGEGALTLVREDPDSSDLPLPPAAEWKRAISRYRA